MIKRCYPNGKSKAFVLTYDDGVLQDVRLVLLLNRYGLKGTFNLNSLLMERDFVWHHEAIGPVRRLHPSVAAHLYEGHEVASHSCTHPDLTHMSWEGLCYELGPDKYLLEQLTGRPVLGSAAGAGSEIIMTITTARRWTACAIWGLCMVAAVRKPAAMLPFGIHTVSRRDCSISAEA